MALEPLSWERVRDLRHACFLLVQDLYDDDQPYALSSLSFDGCSTYLVGWDGTVYDTIKFTVLWNALPERYHFYRLTQEQADAVTMAARHLSLGHWHRFCERIISNGA